MTETRADEGGWDLSWLTAKLAMGGRWSAQSPALLAREGVRRVVDLRAEEVDDQEAMKAHGIQHLHLPTADGRPLAATDLARAVKFVRAGLEARERVLVHCEHGIGRSALVALCVLVTLGLTPLQALEHAKRVRPRVCPTQEQLLQLLGWTAAWRRAKGEALSTDTWDDLANVAYAGL